MNIMGTRYHGLTAALSGYEKTKIPLVGFDGENFVHPQYGDDEGIFYFVPKICSFLNVDLDFGINIFLGGILVFSVTVGIICSYILFTTRLGRTIAIFHIVAVSCIAYVLGGVYIVSASIILSTVPPIVYFLRNRNIGTLFFLTCLLTGLGIGVSNFIRAHSGTGVLIFILTALFLLREKTDKKLISVTLLIVGIIMPALYFKHVVQIRDEFLIKHQPDYESSVGRHVFWHSAYVGLGFTYNPYIEKHADEVAANAVRAIDPNAKFLTNRYNAIIRGEVFRFVFEHPTFFMINMSAKIGVLLVTFLLFSNIGIVFRFFHAIDPAIERAFIFSILFNSLFGIVVSPYPTSILGFVTISAVYGSVCAGFALENISRPAFNKAGSQLDPQGK